MTGCCRIHISEILRYAQDDNFIIFGCILQQSPLEGKEKRMHFQGCVTLAAKPHTLIKKPPGSLKTREVLLCFRVYFTLLLCYSVTLLLCYFVTLSLCYFVTLLLCYFVTLLLCASVPLLLCAFFYLSNVNFFTSVKAPAWMR